MWFLVFTTATTATGRHALVIVVGLSTELEAAGETTRSAATLLRKSSAAEAGLATKAESSAPTTAIHHLEKDLWVDSTHAAAHAATVAKHVGRVNQIFTAVVASSLPVHGLVFCSSLPGVRIG
jgi:hypothetical protein